MFCWCWNRIDVYEKATSQVLKQYAVFLH
jgi:hypothetical protein